MIAFILWERRKLLADERPSPDHVYDEQLQIWIDRPSGLPLIKVVQSDDLSTPFGETSLTETREGADQREIAMASPFGETSISRTVEGADKPEHSHGLSLSPFGETTTTATLEGLDRPEMVGVRASPFGETLLTKTSEGHDQSEIRYSAGSSGPDALTDFEIDALNSHF